MIGGGGKIGGGGDGLQIKAFREDGKPCYEGKSPSGHIWWDICDCVDY